MPTFDFECSQCGNEFEARFPITAIPASEPCLKCGATATRKMGTGGVFGGATPDWKAYRSYRLPLNAKGAKCDGDGHPIVTTRREEDRLLKTLGYDRQ